MRLTVAEVLDQLVAEGLAPPESIDRARAAFRNAAGSSPPWYARVIAGVGAWIATGFLIGFLAVTKIVNDEVGAMIVGAILIGAAVILRRGADPEEEFKRQLALALSLAGQVLVIVGVVAKTDSAALAGLIALVASIILVPLVSDPAHRFMSALIGSIAAVAAMADLRLVWTLGAIGRWDLVVRGSDLAVIAIVAVCAYVWRGNVRARQRELAEMLEPVGYGTVAAVFAVLLFSSVFAIADDLMRGPQSTRVNAWHLGPATTAGITIALMALTAKVFTELRTHPAITAATPILLGVLTLWTPGIIAAVALLALGFDRRNRTLIALAAAFLVEFTAAYYYTLRMTLLEKAGILVASGLFLLAVRTYLELRYKPQGSGA
jgi:Domain of unknown function (DUF4401)